MVVEVRKEGQRLRLGDSGIEITIVEIAAEGGRVRIGLTLPEGVDYKKVGANGEDPLPESTVGGASSNKLSIKTAQYHDFSSQAPNGVYERFYTMGGLGKLTGSTSELYFRE